MKKKLVAYEIIWKTGSSGKIKAEDVISLATLPLLFLQDKGLLPQDIKTLNKISVYSQKVNVSIILMRSWRILMFQKEKRQVYSEE